MFMCSSIQCMWCKSQNFSFLSCFLSQVLYFYVFYKQFCGSALGFQCKSGSSIFCQCASGLRFLMLIKKSQLCDQHFYFYITRPPWRTSELQEKPSALQREHPALLNMKFLPFHFYGSFLPCWIRICIPSAESDPAGQNGSGSTTLRKYGENVDNIFQGRMLD